MKRERCGGCGKEIYPTKQEATDYLKVFRSYGQGRRGKVYPCVFGTHYHVSKGLRGTKGKDVR
jgi:hypothetical protein